MWELNKNDRSKDWKAVGTFASIQEATKRIIELEAKPVSGIHLEMFVETNYGSDEEFLGYFEYTGAKSLYVIKRVLN
ncbi:hypothetical protein LMG28614_05692 [Paraburkholderia ultramafica]|uniref:Uncharacterized protein n=1 Tax=Paraburkholderia ultramafica TaxID=1544867 RepID=A0A6S7BL65_9BURK|nr:hypothetical protein [Paraburkholderia ultramafica]CAB3802765.1 hypothetical protein LMG28614_05692 [Paraburkholderia ultramafica]